MSVYVKFGLFGGMLVKIDFCMDRDCVACLCVCWLKQWDLRVTAGGGGGGWGAWPTVIHANVWVHRSYSVVAVETIARARRNRKPDRVSAFWKQWCVRLIRFGDIAEFWGFIINNETGSLFIHWLSVLESDWSRLVDMLGLSTSNV